METPATLDEYLRGFLLPETEGNPNSMPAVYRPKFYLKRDKDYDDAGGTHNRYYKAMDQPLPASVMEHILDHDDVAKYLAPQDILSLWMASKVLWKEGRTNHNDVKRMIRSTFQYLRISNEAACRVLKTHGSWGKFVPVLVNLCHFLATKVYGHLEPDLVHRVYLAECACFFTNTMDEDHEVEEEEEFGGLFCGEVPFDDDFNQAPQPCHRTTIARIMSQNKNMDGALPCSSPLLTIHNLREDSRSGDISNLWGILDQDDCSWRVSNNNWLREHCEYSPSEIYDIYKERLASNKWIWDLGDGESGIIDYSQNSTIQLKRLQGDISNMIFLNNEVKQRLKDGLFASIWLGINSSSDPMGDYVAIGSNLEQILVTAPMYEGRDLQPFSEITYGSPNGGFLAYLFGIGNFDADFRDDDPSMQLWRAIWCLRHGVAPVPLDEWKERIVKEIHAEDSDSEEREMFMKALDSEWYGLACCEEYMPGNSKSEIMASVNNISNSKDEDLEADSKNRKRKK